MSRYQLSYRLEGSKPAPVVVGRLEFIPRNLSRRVLFAVQFQEISARYPGESRRQRRTIARNAARNIWKARKGGAQ